MTRIPLATDIKTRTLAPDKGAKLKNCYVEIKGDQQSGSFQSFVRKRPAATGGFPVGSGIAQGGIGTQTGLTLVTADTLNTTITTNTTLTSQTNVIAAGSPTITLPTSPTSGQSVSICNIGSGTVTVSPTGTTIPAWTCSWFIWGGFSWGISFGPTCTVTLPSTHDFGTVQFAGPSETPYSVPPQTVTYSTLGYTPCGGQIRKITTKTYSSRNIPNMYKVTATWSLIGVTPNPDISALVEYNANLTTAEYNYSSNVYSLCPVNATSGGGTINWTKQAWGGINQVSYFMEPAGPVSVQLAWTYVTSQLTLYYLDVHEVWTYDLI